MSVRITGLREHELVVEQPSNPLRIAKLREQAVTRRRARAAKRLRHWTGKVLREEDMVHVCP